MGLVVSTALLATDLLATAMLATSCGEKCSVHSN